MDILPTPSRTIIVQIGKKMYLTTWDLLAVMIALITSVTLVITTALANARLQKKVIMLRRQINAGR